MGNNLLKYHRHPALVTFRFVVVIAIARNLFRNNKKSRPKAAR